MQRNRPRVLFVHMLVNLEDIPLMIERRIDRMVERRQPPAHGPAQ
jgi:hypothetical protein